MRRLLGTCDRDGRHTFERDELRDKIDAMLSKSVHFPSRPCPPFTPPSRHSRPTAACACRRFAFQGLFLVALACLVQVPWILAMVEIVPNLAYEVLAR